MIVGQFVHSDLDLSGAVGFLDLHTAAGRDYAAHRFRHPVDTTAGIASLQNPIVELRRRLRKEKGFEGELKETLRDLSNAEIAVSEAVSFNKVDKRISETVEQVFWKPGAMGSQLNTWGWIIEAIIFYKTLFQPAFAVVMPFLILVVPFFLLKYMFMMPISVSQYMSVIQKLLLSNTPAMPFGGESNSMISKLGKYGYLIMSLGVFISNIWNQIQSAIHLRNVASDIRERGQKLLDYVAAAKRLAKLLMDGEGDASADSVGFVNETIAMGAYGMMYSESRALARLKDWVAEVDLRIACALAKGICFPKALEGKNFSLKINGLYHPGVPTDKRILNDYTSNSHTILTGPNRGGKSTLLKSVGLAVMTAQSWGITWARSMEFVPVVRFETALAPADTLGRLSLFEAEIEFAKHLLDIAKKANREQAETPVFIMMDEIFHSTNAHDGAEASLIFLKQLYEGGGVETGSLISTHYRELPDKLNGQANTQCMEAFDDGDKGIHYTYRCIPGVSTISSVREILRERGLIVV